MRDCYVDNLTEKTAAERRRIGGGAGSAPVAAGCPAIARRPSHLLRALAAALLMRAKPELEGVVAGRGSLRRAHGRFHGSPALQLLFVGCWCAG